MPSVLRHLIETHDEDVVLDFLLVVVDLVVDELRRHAADAGEAGDAPLRPTLVQMTTSLPFGGIAAHAQQHAMEQRCS